MTHSYEAAQEALAFIYGGMQAQAALNKILAKIAPQCRSEVTDLVYGALRYHILLQSCLGSALRAPEKLPAKMLAVLELATYSLLFQSRTPPHAIIHGAVELIKKQFGQKLANVGNAVLRNILRAKDSGFGLAIDPQLSFPPHLYKLWLDAYGLENALALAKRSLCRPYAAYRINAAIADKQFIEIVQNLSEAVPMGGCGLAFPPGSTPEKLGNMPFFHFIQSGFLSCQAAGSMAVLDELGVVPAWQKAPIWDACAGNGGKTTALLEAGLRVSLASDINLKRLHFLRKECARLHLPCPALLNASAAKPTLAEWKGNILADVPCSGTGVMHRRPDIKLRWSLERTAQLVQLQRQILLPLADLLKPGAELCYITCAMNPEENEHQIEWLLAERPQFQLVREWQTPIDHPWLEGMYGARLCKRP